MDASEYGNFGAFFRARIMPDLIKQIDPALNHLRQTNPQEWLRIAMELRQRGCYDRVEQLREEEDAIKSLIELINEGLMNSVPAFVKQHTIALERHYVQHGQELDDLMRSSPGVDPMSGSESVDAQLRAMGIKINPEDKR